MGEGGTLGQRAWGAQSHGHPTAQGPPLEGVAQAWPWEDRG